MTQDDVIEMAQEVGMDYLQFISLESMEKVIRFVNLVEIRAADKATQQEQDRCCAIVFGQCESDNVAQRTVNAIRGKA